MTEPELKPLDCPCCGCWAAIIYNYKNFERKSFVILCQNEDCLLQTPQYENMNQAIEAWNTRAQTQECKRCEKLQTFMQHESAYQKAIEFIKSFARLHLSSVDHMQAGSFHYDVRNARELLRELGESD